MIDTMVTGVDFSYKEYSYMLHTILILSILRYVQGRHYVLFSDLINQLETI